MTVDIAAWLRNPGISVADLERLRDRSAGSDTHGAIADAAQAELNRRLSHPKDTR